MSDLLDRLRGRYRIGPGDPPEFGYREFETPPIQREAAAEISALRVRAEKAEAELSVKGGEWCKSNRDAGRGGCGMCVVCCNELRERAEKAEARVKVLEETIAGYERHSYGWPKDDPENTYPDAEDYASECELEHGVTFEWEVAAVIRTERYRVIEHRDEEGNWTSTTAELVKEATGPLPAKEGTDA